MVAQSSLMRLQPTFQVSVEKQLGDMVELLMFDTKAHWSLDYLEWSFNEPEPQVPPFVPQSKAPRILQILSWAPSTCMPLAISCWCDTTTHSWNTFCMFIAMTCFTIHHLLTQSSLEGLQVLHHVIFHWPHARVLLSCGPHCPPCYHANNPPILI